MYQKYKGNSDIVMFDVYVKETHPNAQTPQPTTFAERIKLYEKYQGEYNMTIPALIDDMENSWKKVYLPGPTGCVLINIKGIVVYTIQFIMSNKYSTIESQADKLLNEMENNLTLIDYSNGTAAHSSFTVKQFPSGVFSIGVPSEGSHSIEIFNLQGSSVISRRGYGNATYNFNSTVSAGKYLIRLDTQKQTVVKPIVIGE